MSSTHRLDSRLCQPDKPGECPCSMTIRAQTRRIGTASTWTKSAPRMPWAWAVRKLVPGRAGAAGRGIDPGFVQDLPHRGGGDRVAKFDEFALHPPMSPGGLVPWRCGSQACGSRLAWTAAQDAVGSGGAAPRGHAGAPRVRHPWIPHAGPASSGSGAGRARAGRRLERSLSDNPDPACRPGQIQ